MDTPAPLLEGFVRSSHVEKKTSHIPLWEPPTKTTDGDKEIDKEDEGSVPATQRQLRALIMSGQMFDLVLHVISKPPDQRTDNEVEVLIPWLRKKSDMLNNLSKEILTQLVKQCTLLQVTKDEVIIRQGDRGDCFYIQLSGKSSLFIDTAKSDHDGPLRPRAGSQEEMTPEQALLEEMEEEQRTRTGKKKKMDRAQFGKYILSFDPGKSFGEIALMTTEAIRNASIVADEETDLLIIDRDLFNQTLKAKQETEYGERKAFIDGNPLFRKWSSRFKRLLEMSIRKESYLFNDVIIKQGEPVRGIHFLLKGQAKLCVDPDAHRAQFPRMFEASNESFAKELGISLTTALPHHRENPTQQEQVRVRRLNGYAAAERRLASKATTLCFLDENEVIGDTELVLGLDLYTSTVVCTGPTDVFVLDSKNIERLVHKKNRGTIDILRGEVENKIQGRYDTQLGSQVELYSHLLFKLKELRPKTYKHSSLQSTDKSEHDLKAQEREVMLNQLVKLFIQDRAPMIEPAVPGAVFYRTKAADRAKKDTLATARKRGHSSMATKAVNADVRLQRARKAHRRHPRSRRELERLTIAQDTEGVTPLQDRDSAVNRFLSSAITPESATHAPAHSNHNNNHHPTRQHSQRPHTAAVVHYGNGTVQQQRSGNGSSIFHLTEPELPTSEDPDGQVALSPDDIRERGAMKQIVLNMADQHHTKNASRAKIICSMIEKRSSPPAAVSGLMRPKSAPQNGVGGEDAFDWDTSEHALRELENKLREFHQQHDKQSRRVHAQVPQLRRFSIQRPEEVPIPGGTVYIRQKPCQYPASTRPGGLSSSAHHQHVRRYMIPRDAAAIATKSMALLEQAQHAQYAQQHGYSSSGGGVAGQSRMALRPHTAVAAGSGVQRRNGAGISNRAKSAKGAL